jgi:hypothetical protein
MVRFGVSLQYRSQTRPECCHVSTIVIRFSVAEDSSDFTSLRLRNRQFEIDQILRLKPIKSLGH